MGAFEEHPPGRFGLGDLELAKTQIKAPAHYDVYGVVEAYGGFEGVI